MPKKQRQPKSCAVCEKEFYCPFRVGGTQYSISNKEWLHREYCSQKCSNSVNCQKSAIKRRGVKQSPDLVEKRIAPLRGRERPPFSDEWRENLSIAHLGQKAWNRGMKFPERCGSVHHNWKGGVTSLKKKLKVSTAWKEWRNTIFVRDDFTCKDCGMRGGYLEPHHIIPLKVDMKKIFNIKNGITLCRPCHKKTMGKELVFVDKFSAMIMAQA